MIYSERLGMYKVWCRCGKEWLFADGDLNEIDFYCGECVGDNFNNEIVVRKQFNKPIDMEGVKKDEELIKND